MKNYLLISIMLAFTYEQENKQLAIPEVAPMFTIASSELPTEIVSVFCIINKDSKFSQANHVKPVAAVIYLTALGWKQVGSCALYWAALPIISFGNF